MQISVNARYAEKFPAFRNGALLLMAFLFALCTLQAAHADGWSVQDKNGVHYTLSAQKGKWVLVNFWAPWCPPCIQEMPELAALQKQHKNLQVIGIAVMYQSRKEVMDVVDKQSLPYPIVLGNEDIASNFGEIEGLPTSFLYSPTGKLIGHHQGPLTQHEVELAISLKPEAATLFVR